VKSGSAAEILVRSGPDGAWLFYGGRRVACAVGRGGIRREKREGDGATPVGTFALRGLYFRPDRGHVPRSALPLWPLNPRLGWCDDPLDAAYNRAVSLPYGASAERLWRSDRLYDLIVPLGYNDACRRAGAGSAIFLHQARPGLTPTEGCIAVRPDDLRALLAIVRPDWRLEVEPASFFDHRAA